MKNLSFIVIAWLGLAGVCSAQISSGLVSYWKSDEASGNLLDAHGANALTETSGTIGTDTGKINGARDFVSADTEYFEKADNADLSTGDIDFSFAAWVRPASYISYPTIIAKDAYSAGTNEYILYVNSSSDYASFEVTDSTGTSTTVVWNTTTIAINNWYYVACGHSASGNVIWISVNGGTPITAAHSTGVRDGTNAFQVGASTARSVYFSGRIDEVGFWKRDIRSDLGTLYGSGSGLAYPFGSGSSPVAKILQLLSDYRSRQHNHLATYGVYTIR